MVVPVRSIILIFNLLVPYMVVVVKVGYTIYGSGSEIIFYTLLVIISLLGMWRAINKRGALTLEFE